jgi:hypothetical protein
MVDGKEREREKIYTSTEEVPLRSYNYLKWDDSVSERAPLAGREGGGGGGERGQH